MECPYCDGFAFLNDENREITYKKVTTNAKAYFYRCELCHEEFTTTETDSLTMAQVIK